MSFALHCFRHHIRPKPTQKKQMTIIILLFYVTLLLQTPSSYDNIVKSKKLWFFHLQALYAMLLLLLPSSAWYFQSKAERKKPQVLSFISLTYPIILLFLSSFFFSHRVFDYEPLKLVLYKSCSNYKLPFTIFDHILTCLVWVSQLNIYIS